MKPYFEKRLIINETVRTINIIVGDLTKTDEYYDLVLCSAYKGHYKPSNKSVIQSLFSAGINVEALSNKPKIEGREFGFWISDDLQSDFCKNICCFELENQYKNNYRSLFDFFALFIKHNQKLEIKKIATPILFTQNVGLEEEQMVPIILETAINCFKNSKELTVFSIYVLETNMPVAKAVQKSLENLLYKPYDLFISYPHKESKVANYLADLLDKEKIKYWKDDELKAGSKFNNDIADAIDKSKLFLFLWFDASEQSDYCKRELHFATQLNKTIIPIKGTKKYGLGSEIGNALKEIQWFEYDTEEVSSLMMRIRDLLSAYEENAIIEDGETYQPNKCADYIAANTIISSDSDEYNLQRFIDAQNANGNYDLALEEIKHGRKRSEWMWFVFPQIQGLGYTRRNNYFAIKSLDEAKAYINNAILGERLLEISKSLLSLGHNNPYFVFNSLDTMKLKSCMTLFAHASSKSIFYNVLDKFFGGQEDKKTLELLSII